MSALFSIGLGVGTQNAKGEWLEVFYAQPVLKPSEGLSKAVIAATGYQQGNQALSLDKGQLGTLEANLREAGEAAQADIVKAMKQSSRPLVATILASDDNPSSIPEGYLKLHLLSHRLVKPHGVNLNGLFGVLPNVAWTNKGAIDLAELPQAQLEARLNGETISVDCVDKFPKMTNYVVPAGIRIAHTARVRLGAYIGEGTTVMHEGFVNFNAGTEGPGMIEGRVSAGVFVGKGSDLGGGCSTMGTLSGGGNIVISVGDECLIGANAGIGIPLADRCIVEAGLYITAGTKVIVLDDQGQAVETVKARDLVGKSDLLFRRNSITGAIECKTNKTAIELNEALHTNN
ncbi:2,3,4,5-tetrahydropyridine-2,6-dicarboxylate N-succinyltransferase [Dasania sp. GY-MA-18]|uniref:2,3,4,5-tetrahydropyridine-2,6-dicarboxylate N-succinyltransferase n=1 Tax=Dasania phycosphaerae TaxID=2950436 RepID=A0A9J6RPW6_9GAMM|nr:MULTISPECIES: 2,3,4,5-tetrahydropyridine-2,6-dicarboxylate N-succinyltransferase [Dasania]MCR8923960.1 2,3,4,5-tetrahydropyridine-2,6-dicarboxylate N-succinyltransferase [Dasania sp. GY-MA-18]MCZ0866394.1 2,3,4,5-tetrahydropyridine-2,6-dicarboxylate N-succinyltransferase [Dasania phycosphaerae]MCZ0870118.1 2,3,4,5-tetrahydropyridine-2,6-dicarboxylate N-succinyltransferase [Dasania phycosphaerae]